MITIAAEQFRLTPAIRSHVESNLDKLKELMPNDASVKVFLSEPTRKVFMVLCKVRLWGKDMIIREESENLYKAVESARLHLTRKIIEEKHRWRRLRRRNTRVEGIMIPANAD